MKYEGYLIEVEGLQLPYVENANVFQNGSFQLNKESRMTNEWVDITGLVHHEETEDEITSIKFTIKERDILLQNKISSLFSKRENINVKYYDSFNDEYKEGLFYMENKEEVIGIATKDNVYYNPISISLKEY